MATAPDNRVNIILLSGYLGSGKTTWLRHALFGQTYGNAHVFVQEAAEQPVDDLLLDKAARVTVLTGKAGTIEGRDEMVAALLAMAEARTGPDGGDQPDTLVIETSGLADPADIITAIRQHPILVYHFALRETIIMSDALHFRTALESDPLCGQQILSADRVVIAKAEDMPAQSLSNLVATLGKINPSAPVSLSTFGVEQPVPSLPAPTQTYDPARASPGPPTCVVSLPIPENVDWVEFTVWLSALLHARGDTILRVKGVLNTDAGALLLQSVRKIMQQPEILPPEQAPSRPGDIVFIAEGLTLDSLRTSLLGFLGKEQPSAPDFGTGQAGPK
ncbi:MAG TPA: GTP-binding protein [Roseovarius sp.]